MARILVIDDENNIRLMVRLALQAARHEVAVASDGTEGLDKFGDGASCDVVLLDQRMPGMDGLQVLREMRRRNPSSRIIMITAFGTIDLATEAIQAGAVDFLRKPFTTETLRSAVQMALQEAAPGPESAMPQSAMPRAGFNNASINGFRIRSSTRNEEKLAQDANQTMRCSFQVQTLDSIETCDVVLPNHFVEMVRAHADCDSVPDKEYFWMGLCEESLANYLWQNSEVPPNGVLQITELSTGLRRWIDAVLVG